MNIFLEEIKKYVKDNQYFNTIKNQDAFIDKIWNTFSLNCDIIAELKKMDCWLSVNENRRKKRYDRFVTNWLLRRTSNGKFY